MPPRVVRKVIGQQGRASRKPFVQAYFFLNKWSVTMPALQLQARMMLDRTEQASGKEPGFRLRKDAEENIANHGNVGRDILA